MSCTNCAIVLLAMSKHINVDIVVFFSDKKITSKDIVTKNMVNVINCPILLLINYARYVPKCVQYLYWTKKEIMVT